MPDKFNELLLKPDIIELYNDGITPDYGYLMNGRFEKDMIKTLYPLKTLSGNPISWEASDTEYIFPIVSLEPKQAGSGDPSPENVRPISGYDSVTVTQSKDEAQVKQITLTLPETIYGGTVDAVTGEGSEEWIVKMAVTSTVAVYILPDFENEASNLFYLANLTNQEKADMLLCSHLPTKYIVPATSTDNGIYVNPGGDMVYIRLAKDIANDLQGFKSWLGAQASAGTPVQLAYKLATPEPFQATGNQPLTSLLGYNTIYTNGGSITLNRKARRLEV